KASRRSSWSASRRDLAQPFPVDVRRNLRGLDLAAPTPENVRVRNRDAIQAQLFVYGRFVIEKDLFIRAVRDTRAVDVLNFRGCFPPVTVRQNVMPPDLAARLDLTARRHRP